MRKLRKILCVLLSMALVLSMCSVNVAAANYPKLNKTALTMITGSSTTLKVTGTSSSVSWSSSDSSVCSVTRNGKITAKMAGTAKIYAKVGSKRLYCRVNVVKSHIQTVSGKTLNKGDKITLSPKIYNVKSISAYSTNNSIVKVTNSYVSNGRAKVVIEAVSGGTAYIKISDRNNSKASTSVKITVKAPASQTSTEYYYYPSTDNYTPTEYYTPTETYYPNDTYVPDESPAPAETTSTDNTNNTSNSETTTIRIKVVDNGDGTTKIILIPSNDNNNNNSNNNNTTNNTDNSTPTTSSSGFAEDILTLVNKERAAVGAAPLVLDDELCKAAQIRAVEGGEYFSHTRPDGRICFSILTDMNIYCTNWGENLAQGSSTASGAMNQWMNSTGHRENILDTSWKKIGVGYDSSTNTWCQLFTN